MAKGTLTNGVFFKRAVDWAAKKTGTDSFEVEKYLRKFLDLDNDESELEKLDVSEILDSLLEVWDRNNHSLSCVYWSEGDGETNHYLYSIEENLDVNKDLLEPLINKLSEICENEQFTTGNRKFS